MKKTLAILALSVLPMSVWAGFPNPFHPYMPLGQIDYSTNWLLGKDSTTISFRPNSFTSRTIMPAALLGASIMSRDYALDKHIIKQGEIISPMLKAADHIQYSPAALMYIMKICGVEGRSDWSRMITADLFGEALQAGLVTALKYTVKRERPDGGSRNSYPSGHTATAFMCATLLHKEYGETVSPWISVAGYSVAATTGIFRVESNRHFCSDVLAGAAIGIFSAELAYDLNAAIFGNRGLVKPVISPDIDDMIHWKFSLASDYCVRSDVFNDVSAGPAYSIGVHATYLPWYFGATIYTGVTQMQWIGKNDVYLENGSSVPDVVTVGAGIAMDIPVISRLDICGNAIIGSTVEDCHYRFIDNAGNLLEWDVRTGQRIKADLGISVRTTGFSSIALTAGYDKYKDVWEGFTLGTSFNFIF